MQVCVHWCVQAFIEPCLLIDCCYKAIVYKTWALALIESTVFTWLNAAAIISPVTKIDAATIQGRLLLEGGVYCTKHYYMMLLLKLTSNLKKFQVCYAIMSIP